MYTIRVKDHFDAAHYLPMHEGKCRNLHGHRWEVEVVLESTTLMKGMVVDFIRIKSAFKDKLPDHCFLNDWLSNPTAENVAERLFLDLESSLTFCGVKFKEITVWESPNCSVTYRPED